MELRQYLNIARKWAWLIAASVIIAASASFFASKSATPFYMTKTTLMVGRGTENPNPTYFDMYTSQQLANTYVELARREPVLQGAINNLGLDMNWQSLSGRVSANHIPETQLFEVSVVDSNPYRAKILADAIAGELIEQSPANPTNISREQKEFSQNQLSELQVNIAEAQEEVKRLSVELNAANSARQIDQLQSQINLLEARISEWQGTYTTLLATLQGGDINTLSIVESAQIPIVPFSPNTMTNVITASAIGLALALGGAIFIEFLDDTVKSSDDISNLVNLPTLGGIAIMDRKSYSEILVTSESPMFPISEAFRVLRTNLQFSFVDNPPKSISITSPGPSEGKSVIIANLAVVMAQSGRKVILVDADLRRPVLHKIFNLPNRRGFSDVILEQDLILENYIQRTNIDNLFLLSSGSLPPNPAELLGSERMKLLINEFATSADIVLFDSPPVLIVADASILGSRVDGVFLTCDSSRTRRMNLQRAVEELRRGRANVIGVVLNRVSARSSGYDYNYDYYYQYYGKESQTTRKGFSINGRRLKLPFIPSLSRKTGAETAKISYTDDQV